MSNHLMRSIFWLRRRSFIRITQRTFVMLMPIATIGAYFKLFRDCIFSPDSFLYNIFNLDVNMSDRFWNIGSRLCSAMVQVTFGLFGIYAAYFAAMYTARIYKKDATMAGITAAVVLTFCSYLESGNSGNNSQIVLYSRILGINGVLFALIVGYFVGQIFRFLGHNYVHREGEHTEGIQRRAWKSLRPSLSAIFIGFILGMILYFFKFKILDSEFAKNLVTQLRGSNNLLIIVPLTMLANFAWWSGLGYPIISLSVTNNSGSAIANLNAVLQSGNSANVPYPFLGSSIVQGYGLMGDAAVALALTVALLLFSKNKEVEKISKLNILPVTFGAKNGFEIGIPVLLNPTYLLPIVIVPAINELLAASAISLHWIQPNVYPVLHGVPGILIPFFGTNGNWSSLIFAIILFVIDILIFIPFVKIGIKIDEELRKYDEAKV